MNDAVRFLAISDNNGNCSSIQKVLDSDAVASICVSSPREALGLLDRGLVADYVLLDATRGGSGDYLFDPALMQRVSSERLCIFSEAGDTSWRQHAARWKITSVLTAPLVPQEINRLIGRLAEPVTHLPISATKNVNAPECHIEELDNGRFFMAASPAMLKLYRDVRVLASVDIPVLILGESGVGKENVAMLLHKHHARSEKPMLNINCAALPTELLESELFGYEVGAFTGATRSKPGLFELANKGTLLLDEIGEMSPQMQAKLLHVLQDGSFCRLGARAASRVDVRVLAATNIDMQEAIGAKRFREDLYYRLNTLTITVPPLRERREEIPMLIEQLFKRGALELGQTFECPARIVEAAQDYHWPGNLRELRNFVTRMLILRDEAAAYNYLRSKTMGKSSVPVEEVRAEAVTPKDPVPPPSMKDAVSVVKNAMEIRMLQDALSASGWNRRRAATNLNISYRTLLYKIQQHGLSA